MEPTVEERPSYMPGFTYKPVRQAPRKGAHERTVGHEWLCGKCKRRAHFESFVGIDREETPEEARDRHVRINAALVEHMEAHKAQEEDE